MSMFKSYLQGENGASAAEYALILAIVGAAVATAAIFLGGAISSAINSAGSCIQNTTNC
jgi:pilus assembly protein Flp/PilA